MNRVTSFYRDNWRKYRAVLLVAAIFLLTSAVSLAQTPVPIEIPTGDMIGNLNNWLEIFAPIILFVGMIPVALGLLQYIVRMFRNAFGGGG